MRNVEKAGKNILQKKLIAYSTVDEKIWPSLLYVGLMIKSAANASWIAISNFVTFIDVFYNP